MTENFATMRTANSEQPNHFPKLRVLYVTSNDGCGGGAAFAVCELMLDMKKRHPDIEPVILVKKESYFSELCRQNNIQVIQQTYFSWTIGGSAIRRFFGGLAKRFLNAVYCRPKVISKIINEHFDLIHTNSSVTNMGDIISQKLNLPHIWHFRESGYYYYYSDAYVREKHLRANAVVVISQSNYDTYVKKRKLCIPDNTRIIYDGLKISAPYVKRSPDINNINFCITGGICYNKNQIMIIKACGKLKALTNKFTLNIIGSGKSSYANTLKRLVHSLGLDEKVKFWGYRLDINDILHNMDVGIMPSIREGFGRVTVEYMLNYMPVIGVNTGATPEIVIDGETGFICALNDVDKLAELMRKFIDNPELLSEMGNKGRERAVKNFSLERNTDEIYALYQEVLSK